MENKNYLFFPFLAARLGALKRWLLLLAVYLLAPGLIQAQAPDTVCGTPDWGSLPLQVQQELLLLEQRTQQFIAQQTPSSIVYQNESACPVYTIPVVVHLVNASTVTDAKVAQQLAILNGAFMGTNAELNLTPAVAHYYPAAFANVIGRFRIGFRLAQLDPNGNPTTGIVRVNSTVPSFSWITSDPTYDDMKRSNEGGSDAWNPNKYLNIWVAPISVVSGFPGMATIDGYGTFPDVAGQPEDGIVVRHSTLLF